MKWNPNRNSPRTGGSLDRKNLSHALGETYGGDRQRYETLGYEKNPTVEDYWRRFSRQDVARTIVSEPPKQTWKEQPNVTDDENDENQTTFEEEVNETLFDDMGAIRDLRRADVLAGIGRYGIVLIGFDDVTDESQLAQPVDEAQINGLEDVNYLQPFSEEAVRGEPNLGDDPTDERYRKPETYEIEFEEKRGPVDVHWSRVIHVAEQALDNEVFGTPRLQPVLNRLDDLAKVMGGAAETFWRAAAFRLIANLDSEAANKLSESKLDDLRDDMSDFVHGQDPMLRTIDTDVEMLGVEDVDPSPVIDEILKLISGETGIPKRILTGSEQGELASTQDRATFMSRISERQENFAEPEILRPLLDRLIEFGALPDPIDDSYEIEWPSLFELNEVEAAEVELKKAKAVKQAAGAGSLDRYATTGERRAYIHGWGPEVGSEVDLDPGEATEDLPEPETPEGEPGEEPPGDAGGEPDEGDPEVQKQFQQLATDGGTEE